jgi:hypothetical protein
MEHDENLVESLKFVSDLGAKAAEPKPEPEPMVSMAIEGRRYALKDLKPFLAPTPATLVLATLSGIVDAWEQLEVLGYAEALGMQASVIHVRNPWEVAILSDLYGDHLQRAVLVQATPMQVTDFPFNEFVSPEEFVIAGRQGFVHTDVLAEVIGLASGLTESSVVDVNDNGIGQTVSVRRGVAGQVRVSVDAPFMLAPYRTFGELEQPFSPYIFRVKRGGPERLPDVGLFAVDDPTWIGHTIASIRSFLVLDFETRKQPVPPIIA